MNAKTIALSLIHIFNRTHQFISDAVQNGDEFATFQAKDVQRMVRLPSVEQERFTGAAFRWQIKTVHGALTRKTF